MSCVTWFDQAAWSCTFSVCLLGPDVAVDVEDHSRTERFDPDGQLPHVCQSVANLTLGLEWAHDEQKAASAGAGHLSAGGPGGKCCLHPLADLAVSHSG